MKAKFIVAAVATLLAAAVSAAESDDARLTTQAAQMDSYAASRGQTAVTSKTAADFSAYYGQDNAQALASGLRSGSQISLTTRAADGSVSTATFTPPTRPMGNGNVFISMALAKQQLAAAGITQPTAEQIQKAMTGGTITVVDPATGKSTTYNFGGVLQMRADGMGWGQIAHAMGTKLGPVVSGIKSANASLAASQTAQAGAAAGRAGKTGAGGGVTTASGSAAGTPTGGKPGKGGSGIVTGGGQDSGGGAGVVTGGGKSQGQGAGIVTGGGGGQGNAYGKGGKP